MVQFLCRTLTSRAGAANVLLSSLVFWLRLWSSPISNCLTVIKIASQKKKKKVSYVLGGFQYILSINKI